MKKNTFKTLLMALAIAMPTTSLADDVTRTDVESKMNTLQQLINTAKQSGKDVTREEMTMHTASLYLDYADYDQANQAEILAACQKSSVYKNQAATIAPQIPIFERSECLAMIETAITTLNDVISGTIPYRRPVPSIDWKGLHIDGNSIVTNDNTPVFLADYTWKPSNDRLTKYYGNLGGFHYDLSFLGSDLKLSSSKLNELKNSDGGTFGSPFLGHGVASWMITNYPGIDKGSHTFNKYDIDHPQVRVFWDAIFSQEVPYLKGQSRSALGYLLANEPHWQTAAKSWDTPEANIDKANTAWDTNGVSDYTITKFKEWLKQTHGDITTLNKVWKTSYSSFDDVEITVPVDNHLLGSAKWYDWMKFNQWRVTDWFNFLIGDIQKYDPDAIANIKIMPNLWTENARDHGLDFEALCNLSGVIGNDAAANQKKAWGGTQDWEANYDFNWRELCMGYDFFKSVSPDKPMYNSENHYTQSTAFMKLELPKEYARCLYWNSTILGCNVNQSWVWIRKDDEVNKKYPVNTNQDASSFVGSFSTQPRILNETTLTFMDLNANGKDIKKLQDVRRPIRIYYTETSALNKRNHMDEQFELYEKLFFTGIPIGFVTENILKTQDSSQWDVILIRNSENVTATEIAELQKYLDNGGTIIMDRGSCYRNEYMIKHTTKLKASNGNLISATSLDDFASLAISNMKPSSKSPVSITEANSKNMDLCFWRAVESESGRYVVSVSNFGNVPTTIDIKLNGNNVTCRDMLTFKEFAGNVTLNPEDVLFFEVGNFSSTEVVKAQNDYTVYPSLFTNTLDVCGVKNNVTIYNLSGTLVKTVNSDQNLTINTANLASGMYIVNIDGKSNHKVIKR